MVFVSVEHRRRWQEAILDVRPGPMTQKIGVVEVPMRKRSPLSSRQVSLFASKRSVP